MSKQGASNTGEFFKKAKLDDDEGMSKYAVDLGEPEDIEKISTGVSNRKDKTSYTNIRTAKR